MKESWQIAHLGIPVNDLDQAITRYTALGASFEKEFLINSTVVAEYLVYGEVPEPPVITRGIMGKLGPMPIELLQPVQGHTVHQEKLNSTGEGVGHIAYYVDDIEAEAVELEAQDCPVILSIRPGNQPQRSAIYFDTRDKLSNLITELIQKRDR